MSNLSLWFGNLSLGLHSADFANLGRLAQTSSPALRPKFAKNHESQTENPSVVDSALGAQNLGEKSNKKSLLKFLLLFAFAKSRVPLNFTNSNLPSKVDSQNLGESSEKHRIYARFCEFKINFQNLRKVCPKTNFI